MNETATHIIPRPKTPMAEAASLLDVLCNRLDSGEDPTAALVEVFNETRLELAHAVDRRIAFDHWIKGKIAAAKEARDEWAQQSRQLERLHERFKENTKQIVEAYPELPYQGKLGKIAVQDNPPALHLAFAAKDISPDMIKAFCIEQDYVKVEVVYSVDTAKVKADLLEGKEIPWAHLERGSHIRFRK